MIELLGGGIFGSLLGGLFLLAPEVLKWMDKKNERAHELQMFTQQCQLETLRSSQKLAEIGAQREATVDAGVMDAFNSAIKQQADMVKDAGGWAASLSASVRPVMTYYLLVMYGAAKSADMMSLNTASGGAPAAQAVQANQMCAKLHSIKIQ